MRTQLYVYQYADPNHTTEDDPDGVARWIAARSEHTADKAASQRGWRPCGGRIFRGWTIPRDPDELSNMGVDLILDQPAATTHSTTGA